MQILETNKDGLKRHYRIKIEASQVDDKNANKISEIQKIARFPGFRPGKVPKDYLFKRFGVSITKEIIDELVKEGVNQIIEQDKLRLAMSPKLNVPEYRGQDLECDFECEIMPDIKDDYDYSKIKLINYKVTISDNDIEDEIKKLSAKFKEFKLLPDQNSKAKKGMAVRIDYKGFIGDEAFAGGEDKDFVLELGSGQFIAGFEDQLIGARIGESKKVKVRFPKEYHAKNLADQQAIFEVNVKEILEVIPPVWNDDLAKKAGSEDLESLKREIRNSLEHQYVHNAKDQIKKELFDYLEDKVSLVLPESMVNAEFATLIKQYLQDKGFANEEEAENKEGKNFKKEKKEFLRLAERRVKIGLFLSALAEKNNIEVTKEELFLEAQNRFQRFGPVERKDVMQLLAKNPQFMQNMEGAILETKVVEHILSKSNLKDKEYNITQFNKIFEN